MKNLNTPEMARTLFTINSEENSPSICRDAILLPTTDGEGWSEGAYKIKCEGPLVLLS